MYTMEEIKVANSTCRTSGASAKNKDGSIRAVVPKYVFENINPNDSLMDFGAGKGAVHTLWLKENGFTNVTAYEFGDNIIDGIHDRNALSKQYKVIMASNVLNVQSSMKMLMETLDQIYNCLIDGGQLVANYPASPRKMDLSAKELAEIISNKFGMEIKRVGGIPSVPVWVISKSYKM